MLKEVDKKLLEYSSAPRLIRFLQGKSSYVGLDEIKLHLSESACRLNKFWKSESNEMNLYGVFALRNKAIHFCLSIPEKIAEAAVNMAEKNLKDFQEEWVEVTLSDGAYGTMSWNELCGVCGINFLPKQREGQK